jgi:hypothetical protein
MRCSRQLLKLQLWVQRSGSQSRRCMLNIGSSQTSQACCSLLLLLCCSLLRCQQQLLLMQLLHCSRSTTTQRAARQAQVADAHKPAQELLHLPLLLLYLCQLLYCWLCCCCCCCHQPTRQYQPCSGGCYSPTAGSAAQRKSLTLRPLQQRRDDSQRLKWQ